MALDTPKPPHSSVPDLNSVAWQRYFLSLGQYLTTQYIQQTQINQQFNAVAGSGMLGTGDGEDGQDGLPGIQGIQGVQGLQGMPGRDGEDGQDGEIRQGALPIDLNIYLATMKKFAAVHG